MAGMLYNLALSIGNHTDMQCMLDESLDAYLEELRCDGGFVCASQRCPDGGWQMDLIHARIKDTAGPSLQTIVKQILPHGKDSNSLKKFYGIEPIIQNHGTCQTMVMPLQDFGALILIRSGASVDKRTLLNLSSVNHKLARACINLSILHDSGRSMAHDPSNDVPLVREIAYLDQLFDNAQVGIIMAENDGTVLRINPEFQKIFGFSFEEALGRNIDELVAAKEDLNHAARVTQSVSEGQKHAFEARRRSKDGSVKHVAVMASPIVLNGKQVAVYAFYRDITLQRQMEAELLKAKKLEATGKLAGGIAHDFNNLLAVIMGNIDIALLRLSDNKMPDATHLDQARKVCARAHELTQKFITFSAGGLLIKKPVDLSDLLHRLGDKIFKSTTVDYSLDMAADMWTVQADLNQLSHALIEILTNAVESLPDGGRVRITSANITDCTYDSEFADAESGPGVRLVIEDNGIGISSEVLPQIFDPYYSTKQLSKRTGLGLGLTIAHSVVTKHGGTMRIESRQPGGTKVVVELPVGLPSVKV